MTWWMSSRGTFSGGEAVPDYGDGFRWGRLSPVAKSLYESAPRGVFFDYAEDHPDEFDGLCADEVRAAVARLRRAYAPAQLLQ